MPEISFGQLKILYGDKMTVGLSDIPALFHRIPGATEILDEVFAPGLNKYQLYNRMVKRDSDLNTAIMKMSILVERCYQGIMYHPGEDLEDKEKTFLKTAQRKALDLKFDQRFYVIARRLLIDGDVIAVKHLDVNRLDFLPMEMMTAANKMEDLTSVQILSGPPGVYIFNEFYGEPGRKLYKPEEVMHIALANDAEMVTDNQNRLTWGIWSQSPLEALRPIILWRLSTIVNDMIWRKLYLPREHHEIDLTDVLNPDQYDGDTMTERRAAALVAGAKAIEAYIAKLKNQMPDQGYVTPKVGEVKGVDINIIEPKSTTYVSPNELLKQLAQGVQDTYFVKSVSQTKESFAAELVAASIEQLMAEFLAQLIKNYLLVLLREALGNTLEAEELDIKLQLILPKDVESLTRQVAVLASANIYTINEMREVLGKDPLTEDDRVLLEEEIAMRKGPSAGPFGSTTGPNANSPDETAAQIKRGVPQSKDKVQTPQSDKANQKT